MTLLLQASDTHFGTERPAAKDALAQLVHEQRPDVLLLSGDITQRATRTQFDSARAFVDRLQVPAVLAIPGNHDIPLFKLVARLFSPYAHYMQAFACDLGACRVHRSSAWYAGSSWRGQRDGAWSLCTNRWP